MSMVKNIYMGVCLLPILILYLFELDILHYGHGKMEAFYPLILSLWLGFLGIFLIWDSYKQKQPLKGLLMALFTACVLPFLIF